MVTADLALNYETTSLVCELYSQLTKEEADTDKLCAEANLLRYA